MTEAFRNLFRAPIFGDNRRNHVARLVQFISLLFVSTGLLGLLVLPFWGTFGSRVVTSAVGLILLGVIGYGILRTRYVEASAFVLVSGIWLLAGFTTYQVGTINSPATAWYLLAVVCAAVLIHAQAAALATLASILLLFGFGLAERGGVLSASAIPDSAVWLVFSFLMVTLFMIVARDGIQHHQVLTSSQENEQKLAQLNYELAEQVDSLTRRVSERTNEVSQYLLYMQISMELSHLINAYPDAEQLMEEAIDLLQKRFGLYYVGIFQVENTGQWAILRAGSGETGQVMLARHHQIDVGSGMIGWCIANSRARVAADAGADSFRVATPELPHTRSEAAIPMRSLGKVTGAISVQSIKPDAFSQELVAVLQSYADMLASAIENIELNAEKALRGLADQNSTQTQERSGWFSAFGGRGARGILYDRISISPMNETLNPEVAQVRQTRKPRRLDGESAPTILVPVSIRDQVVGVLSFRKSQNEEDWSDREIELLELLAAQLGEAMDNARLYQSLQRQAEREQMLAGLTTRMRETLDVDTVLRTAANEIFQALALEEVSIELAEDEPVLVGGD